MNCHLIVHTECCKNNCQTLDDMDEYEDETNDEEEIETCSEKTFPVEDRP